MKKKKKCTLFVLFCLCVVKMGAQELTLEERLTQIEQGLRRQTEKQKFMPQIHGILRGKYEYEPDLNASRFEVRNARLSVDGNMLLKSSYKLEVDLCDESAIKMKDAWVRVNPISTFRITLGQQRMPFSIDAHRNPSAQFFANRSFIAKQVGDMRDVGAAVGYDIISMENRKILSVDAGIYNGSNLDNQKTAWFTSPAYSARIQYFPVRGLALIPSVQHQLIASRNASYTSIDYAMAIYKIPVKKGYLGGVSYLLRYDYMDNHSDGTKGFAEGTTRLLQSDAQRHRLTAGLTFHVANKFFPTDIRLNYENYWYPNGGTPKESEQDKLVAELMIRF